MRMSRARIDFKLAEHGPGKFILGEHTFDGFLDKIFRLLFKQLARGDLFQPADISRVTVINFVGQLAAGKGDLLSVYYDDEIAGINTGCVESLVFPAQHTCYLSRQ